MKIALVSDCYLPRLGGIEVQVHDLAQRLVAQGHEVVAYTVTPAHREQHSGSEATFWSDRRLDPFAIADRLYAEYLGRSPTHMIQEPGQ